MIYIHAHGIHNTIPADDQPDLMKELKELTGKVYRRSDHFVQLAIIGAHKAVNGYELPEQTAIYLTSGQGNISVFSRICEQRHIYKCLPRPVDFINLLSNSAGFYVADHLGLNGKNLFLSHHCFPVQMTMLAACNEIKLRKQPAILAGGVDEWFADQRLAKNLLGVEERTVLGEGSNWLLLSPKPEGALAAVEIKINVGKNELPQLLSATGNETWLAFSTGFPQDQVVEIMNINNKCKRYSYEESCGYYETLPFYVLSRFLGRKRGRLIHLDISDGRYVAMIVERS
jgi:hypothetical protein